MFLQTLMFDIGAFFFSLITYIPKLMYLLANSFLALLDLFQWWLRKLAGLDVYYVDGEAQTGDIVYHFIRGIFLGEYPALHNVFIGLVILGIILLLLSTIISIIRNEYTAEKDGNSKGKIIGQSFKSIIYVAIVPIICLFGVYLSNILLVAVDRATSVSSGMSTPLNTTYLEPYTITYSNTGQSANSGTETTAPDSVQTYTSYNIFGQNAVGTTGQTFSGLIFKASAYSANRVRATENTQITSNGQENINGFFQLLQEDRATNFGGLFKDDNNDSDTVAMYIDQAFADNVRLKEEYWQGLSVNESYVHDYMNPDSDPIFHFSEKNQIQTLNRFDVNLVWYFYDLWRFDFVVCFGAVIIMLNILINIIFGLIKRLIELAGLFLISAPLIALMPLDNGGAYNKWRGKFLKSTLMAYGAIGGMNILFLLLPYLNEISFFNDRFADGLANTIIIIVGLILVKDFISMISDFVGGADANKEGESIDQEVGKMVAKAGAATLGAGALAGGMLAGGVALAGKGIAAGASNIKKRVTAQKKLEEYDTERTQKRYQKTAEQEDLRDERLQDIDNRQAEYEANARASVTAADVEEIHNKYSTDADRQTALENLIQQRTSETMQRDRDAVQQNFQTEVDAIEQEFLDTQKQLSDFKPAKLSTIIGGAAKKTFSKETGAKALSKTKSVAKGILPAVGRTMTEAGKITFGSLTDNQFSSGVKSGAGGDGAIDKITTALFKDYKKSKADKKAVEDLVKQKKADQKAIKEYKDGLAKEGKTADLTTDEVLKEIHDYLKKKGI